PVPIYDPGTTQLTAAGAYTRSLFTNNTIPRSQFDHAAADLLDRYPLPNVFLDGKETAANNYRRLSIDTTDNDQFDTRLDRYSGERRRVFGRYTFLRDHSAPGTPLPDGSGAITSGVISDTFTRADSVAMDYTYTRSANAVNQLRIGFSRRGF